MNIYDLKVGECGKITKITTSGSAAIRLNFLGICTGKKIKLLSYSLFKSSVLISCGTVRVGMRKLVALSLEVEKCL